jgi:excinuclease ABC subunit A
MNRIKIRGARQHNLKSIDVDIPRNQLVVITGLSGSGKSTLAFDTLYAEGQRRYVESLSTYARQFLERMPKPDADLIEGLSPAIAIQQKTTSHNPRSTVGTVTEIHDHLRLLYARVGEAYCYQCGAPIVSSTIDQMVDDVTAFPERTRVIIMAPLMERQPGPHTGLIQKLRRDGFARLRINGETVEMERIKPLLPEQSYTIEVVVDRLVVKAGHHNRLADSLELAMGLSSGAALIELTPPGGTQEPVYLRFNECAVCPKCNIRYPDYSPAHFSFNSPHGACPSCNGLGTRADFDRSRIIPDEALSIAAGAIRPWANRQSDAFKKFVEAFSRGYGASSDTPFKALPEDFKKAILFGTGSRNIRFTVTRRGDEQVHASPFEGLIPQLNRRYHESESTAVREEMRQYMAFAPCPACKGSRLKAESRSVKINGQAIHQLSRLSVTESLSHFRALALEGQQAVIAEKIVSKIIERLEFLIDVGLGYLTLDRVADTLSGGESQRIRLATQIGARLTGILYVLDEPSIGLHARDNRKLRQTLLRMRDMGNTVLVVEHDPETIMAADYVIDMGPGAGERGGEVIYAGPARGLPTAEASLTGQYLSGKLKIAVPRQRRRGNGLQLRIDGAAYNNLKTITASFPLGCLVCVSGVSGSGKSSLVIETLYRALVAHQQGTVKPAGRYRSIEGIDYIDKVINVDQSPIGRTPRSNPGTYTGLFGFIREVFSKTPDARVRGYKPGRFSFNVKGGRCEVCKGDGLVKIEMQFLPDIFVPCDGCGGKRFNRESLEIRYKGNTIADVLDMTVHQALACFGNIGSIRDRLQTLIDVGLAYIRLGQPASTLSGGEAQRVKLARELSKRSTGRTLYILDEPTSGLHMEDINKLLEVLNRLVDAGNTVVVIEHNLDVIKTADHVIDLGPEGGDGGGYLVAAGSPEEVAERGNSYTGHYLRPVLGFE